MNTTACELAAMACQLQAQQRRINNVQRLHAHRPAWVAADEMQAVSYASGQNRRALAVVMRALASIPAANA